MTDEELDAIEARAMDATGGPWLPKYAKVFYPNGEAEHWVKSTADGLTVASLRYRPQGREIGEDQSDLDALFIAHARTDIPALLAEVKRLRKKARAEGGKEQP